MNINDIIIEQNKIVSEGWTDNLITSFGNQNQTFLYSSGNNVNDNRLWDLASVTKLYSLILILLLHEQKQFNITKQIKDYSNLYPNISDIYIYELLNFSYELCTPIRIDKCNSYSEALSALYNVEIKNRNVTYSDIGIMIVIQIINEFFDSDLFFYEYSRNLFKKVGLTRTLWWTDIKDSETNIEVYDFEHKIINDKIITLNTKRGECHDKKGQIIPYAGHAGLFSSAKDISLFSRKLLTGAIISDETISLITDTKYDAWNLTHHYGLLCNKKHNIEKYTEVPFSCSENSIAISGYTGCYLLLDFNKKIFVFIGANRINNKITNINYGEIDSNYICTKDYVFRKDYLLKSIINSLYAS